MRTGSLSDLFSLVKTYSTYSPQHFNTSRIIEQPPWFHGKKKIKKINEVVKYEYIASVSDRPYIYWKWGETMCVMKGFSTM